MNESSPFCHQSMMLALLLYENTLSSLCYTSLPLHWLPQLLHAEAYKHTQMHTPGYLLKITMLNNFKMGDSYKYMKNTLLFITDL